MRALCWRSWGVEVESVAVHVRPFAWADIEGIARLHRDAEPVDGADRQVEAIALARRWRRASDPERQCLVAECRGRLLGYARYSRLPGTAECVLDGVVHPAWRRRGIGRALVQQAIEVVRRAGVRSADLRVRGDDSPGAAFCQALGFGLVRVWQRMWLWPLRVPPLAMPAGYGWRAFRPHADEAAYAALVNETMAGHWGTGLSSAGEVARMAGEPGFDPGAHLFATQGRELVGLCSARYVVRCMGARELAVAHLGPIGVRPAHRGRGVAGGLIAASLGQCRRRRLQAAELDVDAENAPAVRLYRRCGMAHQFDILWYRKELPAAPVPR